MNINNDTTHCYHLGSDDEVLYNFNKYDIQLFCGFVTQSIKCDLLSYFHKYIYDDLDLKKERTEEGRKKFYFRII